MVVPAFAVGISDAYNVPDPETEGNVLIGHLTKHCAAAFYGVCFYE